MLVPSKYDTPGLIAENDANSSPQELIVKFFHKTMVNVRLSQQSHFQKYFPMWSKNEKYDRYVNRETSAQKLLDKKRLCIETT